MLGFFSLTGYVFSCFCLKHEFLISSLLFRFSFFGFCPKISEQELKPSFSHSIEESSVVKDLRWTRKAESSYLVLSNNGKLYHAVDDSPPRHVMDGVDAGIFCSWLKCSIYVHICASTSPLFFFTHAPLVA